MPNFATLNIRTTPRRMLTESEAADYCGTPKRAFVNYCSVRPVAYPDGRKLYDMHDLDRWIDALKHGEHGSDDDILRRLE